MLLGTYPAKLAGNHRTAIPSPIRKELGENIIIAKWYEECLVIVSKDSLKALLSRITGKSDLITKPVRGSEHFIFTGAFETQVDDQGRIVIPESLVKYGNFGEDIYFLGVNDRVEIWNKQAWDTKLKQVVKDAPDYIEELAKNEK